MKIKESELREIIASVIQEALDPNAVKTAQSYMNHKGGYTTNQRFDGLGGSLRQMFGAKNDSNGQRDWEKSANEMQGAIRSYTNEIKRLTRVYNIITNHQTQGWSDERKAKAAQTRAFNSQWKKDNGVDGSTPTYQNRAVGTGVDSTKYAQQRQNARAQKNAVAAKGNQSWMVNEEEIGESFLGNIFGKNRVNNDVEQICQNYKQYIGNQEAAQAIASKIQEYKGIVNHLKGIIKQGVEGGHLQNNAAAQRAQMAAARKASQNQYRQVAESIERIVSEKLRQYLG